MIWDPARGRLSCVCTCARVCVCLVFGAVEVALLRDGVRDSVPGSLLFSEAGVGQVQVCVYVCGCVRRFLC